MYQEKKTPDTHLQAELGIVPHIEVAVETHTDHIKRVILFSLKNFIKRNCN